jgi:methylthioribose-1-phosphate isomerase
MRADILTPLIWTGDALQLLDQRRLPQEQHWLAFRDADTVAAAITDMVVRGAPAIGIAAAYGLALAARAQAATLAADPAHAAALLAPALQRLGRARPTAVNLRWALARLQGVLARQPADPAAALTAEAIAIHDEDIAANRAMGRHGAALLPDDCTVYTHCNAGALATGGYGTALGVVRSAHENGKLRQVYAGETRPWLQGARLTAWELAQDGIPVTLLVDAAAAQLFRRGGVAWVIVGADRITANGDIANKIGTYALAVLARHHGVKFMVAAPLSTIDMQLADGQAVPIEERAPEEVTHWHGVPVAAPGVPALNPSFDVTPAELIDAIVTERGVIARPDAAAMRRHVEGKG